MISVDFALASENRFPKLLDDCYPATSTISNQASNFAINAQRIAVVGDSAGGNLAAAVAIKSRDEGGPPIKLQVLLCPVVTPNFDSESCKQFATGYGLTRTNMQWFWE